jgi:multiple sugar transport system permease protein
VEHGVSFVGSGRLGRPRRRARAEQAARGGERRILSSFDWGRRRVRWAMRSAHGLALLALVVTSLGPIVWLAKAATSTTQDTLRTPMELWPSGFDGQNLAMA